jgi:hypothetical protein
VLQLDLVSGIGILVYVRMSTLGEFASMPNTVKRPWTTAHQPVTVIINSVRTLLEGGVAHYDPWLGALWCFGIFVLFLLLSMRLCRHITG